MEIEELKKEKLKKLLDLKLENSIPDPYVINFNLKTSENNEIDNKLDKQIKKKPIKQIDINEKNIICELKSFSENGNIWKR